MGIAYCESVNGRSKKLEYSELGKAGMGDSVLSYGVSPRGGVFDEAAPKFRAHF